ncbi:MAG: AMP-binding protein [Burkholderiaceae bacterium]|jgi:acyl-CoA synthetase (AMP-forming)/AMP-acid ligase II|nr:AMP-binding protein [Burkholderiaceae bacterium]
MIAGRLISWAAAQHGPRPSLLVGDRSFSHAEIEARSNRLAQALIALGLAPGERLAVLLENSVESLDSLFGAEKAALAYVALNARHTLAEHLDILEDAQASAVLIGPQFASLAAAFAAARGARLPDLRLVLGLGAAPPGVVDLAGACAAAPDEPPAIEIEPEHLLRVAYTSGTTGRPKGVAYTLERWQARLHNHFLAMEYGLSVDDAMLHVGPLTHAAGVYLFPCFLRGARNVVLDRFDPASLLAAVEQHRITHLMLVPTMMSRLVDAIEGGLEGDWSSLQRIHYGTAPTPVSLIRRALRLFGPILRQQYGMTEAVQPLTVLYPHEHVGDGEDAADEPIGSCGRPTANVRVVLRDTAGREVPPGEVGEITLAHEGIGKVMLWRRPELMTDAVRDGWYYSGDLGRFDRAGFLHIVGRNKDMIISGGFNVYAREVEDALASHPAVLDSAVIGLPDLEWGEVVAAAVVLRDGATADALALQAHCAERIASYKKPRRIAFVAALPRNLAGKVVKGRLRECFETGAALS